MDKKAKSNVRTMEKKAKAKCPASSSTKPAPPSTKPAPPSKKAESTVDLNLRIASAFKNVIVTTRNESFREQCLQTLKVTNGSEAEKKVVELLVKFKDSKKAKWCH